MFTLLKITLFAFTIAGLNAATNETRETVDLGQVIEDTFLSRSYKLPLVNFTIPDDLIKAYNDACEFLKQNQSAQNLHAFALKNPKLSAFIGVTSCVGIYMLLFHGLSIFSKKKRHHDDDYATAG